MAQDVEKALPSFVKEGKNVTDIKGESFTSKSVNYLEMIPLLIKAIQEQQLIIEELSQKLEIRIQELEEK